MSMIEEFKIGDKVIYPGHAIGRIVNEEFQKREGVDSIVLVIEFTKEKMILNLPKNKASDMGLRHLIDKSDIKEIYKTLESKPKFFKGMWTRKAQECETKISSGNVISLAEVVRDLFKTLGPNRSYSEKVIYERALERLISEIAEVEGITEKEIEIELLELLGTKEAA